MVEYKWEKSSDVVWTTEQMETFTISMNRRLICGIYQARTTQKRCDVLSFRENKIHTGIIISSSSGILAWTDSKKLPAIICNLKYYVNRQVSPDTKGSNSKINLLYRVAGPLVHTKTNKGTTFVIVILDFTVTVGCGIVACHFQYNWLMACSLFNTQLQIFHSQKYTIYKKYNNKWGKNGITEAASSAFHWRSVECWVGVTYDILFVL